MWPADGPELEDYERFYTRANVRISKNRIPSIVKKIDYNFHSGATTFLNIYLFHLRSTWISARILDRFLIMLNPYPTFSISNFVEFDSTRMYWTQTSSFIKTPFLFNAGSKRLVVPRENFAGLENWLRLAQLHLQLLLTLNWPSEIFRVQVLEIPPHRPWNERVEPIIVLYARSYRKKKEWANLRTSDNDWKHTEQKAERKNETINWNERRYTHFRYHLCPLILCLFSFHFNNHFFFYLLSTVCLCQSFVQMWMCLRGDVNSRKKKI